MENITFKLKTDEVRKIRQQKGLSQDNMAADMGLSQSQYSRIEQGDCAVPFEKVIEISKILNVSPDEITECKNWQTFYNCNQAGNHNTQNNNQDCTEILKALLEQMKNIQVQNAELLKMAQKLKN